MYLNFQGNKAVRFCFSLVTVWQPAQRQVPCTLRVRALPGTYGSRTESSVCYVLITTTGQRSQPGRRGDVRNGPGENDGGGRWGRAPGVLSDGYVTRESALGRLSVEAGKGGAGTQAVGECS